MQDSPTTSVVAPIAPLTSLSNMEQVTDEQLAKYATLIYRRTGIRVSPQKKTLLSNRVRRRLRQTGIKDFEDYYKTLTRLRANDPEWDAFLQEITTHETYLFRDEGQWNWLRKTFLPEYAARTRSGSGKRSLRVWSAACSTGDEATTIASCIAGNLPNYQSWDIDILGTDIGVGAIEESRAAIFGERAMRLVPSDYKRRFFTKAKDGEIWQAKSTLTDMCRFKQHNLMDPLREKPFDLVYLKNVLIYFDTQSKTQVLDNIRGTLKPGALLVAGAAEGVADLIRDFVRIQPWLYRYPG